MELKNGSTFNGHLVACDNFMNLVLRQVYETSAVSFPSRYAIPCILCLTRLCLDAQSGEQFWKQTECYIRGSTVSPFPTLSPPTPG